MRSANFNMGSILPEHNRFKTRGLERNASGATIGLSKAGSFKPAARPSKMVNSQSVSAGNNIARGVGSFKTVN